MTQNTENKGKLSQTFKNCAHCARDGLGGAMLSHVGCVVIPLAAASMGTAVSGTLLAATMYVTAPLIAIGATWGLDRMRGKRSSVPKLAGSAGIALAMAMVISTLTGGHDQHAAGHDHHNHDHHEMHDHGHMTPAAYQTGDICYGTPQP